MVWNSIIYMSRTHLNFNIEWFIELNWSLPEIKFRIR